MDGDFDSGEGDPPHSHSLGSGSPSDGVGCLGWVLIASLLYVALSLVLALVR